MNTKRNPLKRDSRGQFRPRIGWHWEESEAGKRSQVRFNLGTDERAAQERYFAIQNLYAENCETNGENCWSPLALSIAREIAKGKRTVAVPSTLTSDPEAGYEDPVTEYAQMIDVFRRDFPSVNFSPGDQPVYQESLQRNKELITQRMKQLEAELQELGALVGQQELPDMVVTGTLHESLKAYRQMIDRDGERLPEGNRKPSQRLRQQRVDRFKEHHADFPLHELTYDRCKELIDHWRNRPATKRGTRSSHDNARHHIVELYAYFRWLDATDQFAWQMPKGVERLNRKVVRLHEDRKKSVVSKSVYSPDELGVIARHATDWERLSLLVGLNCAMGAAELGRITRHDVLFDCRHEYADRLQFTSTYEDSFLRTYRPKTDVFGEWLLWPETVEMLRWAVKRSKHLKTELVFVRNTGKPLYAESSKNPAASFSNLWTRLLARVRKHEGENFRKLPFGTLRDTLPDMLRHTHSDELASLCLAHGSPGADSLIDCYGNRPYGRLHEAIRQHRATFNEVLEPKAAAESTQPK